jgi:UDP-glucose 4-epimerase
VPIHHAPHVVFANNVMAGFNVVEACVRWQVPRLVNISSETVPGFIFAERPILPPYLPIDEQTPAAPQDPYGFGKHVIEQWCDAAVARSELSVVSIRPSWVQRDADDYERNLGPIVRDPTQPSLGFWSYTDNEDLAVAIRLAVEVPLTGHEVVYVAQPDNATTRRLDELVAAAFPDAQIEIRDPATASSGAGTGARASTRRRRSDCSDGRPPAPGATCWTTTVAAAGWPGGESLSPSTEWGGEAMYSSTPWVTSAESTLNGPSCRTRLPSRRSPRRCGRRAG